jgi:hypothetical protein
MLILKSTVLAVDKRLQVSVKIGKLFFFFGKVGGFLTGFDINLFHIPSCYKLLLLVQ